MLSHIAIRNYQSLGDISLDLKPFTVIVGPSSSGKSAFTRALKTLTSNARGDSFITHGETQCTIKAVTDRGTVALLRGKKNAYVLIPENDTERQQTFTKLNGAVPEEVSAFLGIPANDPLNYADQFDMPYMLKRSGGDVARELGALTNVAVIFEASREANRRRLAASGTLKTRAADYQQLTSNLERYRTLEAEARAVESAEKLLSEARALEQKISLVRTTLATVENLGAVPAPRELPDTGEVVAISEKLSTLTEALELFESSSESLMRAEAALDEIRTARPSLEEEYAAVLREAGTCPTCGQETTHVH